MRYFIALGTTALCYLWVVGSKEHVVPISECCEHQIDVLLVVNVSMVLAIYSQFFWLLTMAVSCHLHTPTLSCPMRPAPRITDPRLRIREVMDNLHLAVDPGRAGGHLLSPWPRCCVR